MALRPYALLPRQYDDRKVLASTVDAWGRALWLICPDAVFSSNSYGRARPEPLSLPFDALVVINDAGAVQERTLRRVTVIPYRVDALPNGRIVLEGRSSVGDRNAQIFGRDGRSRRCFAMGACVAFMMADRRNNLWTAYGDEGIYSDPISSAGLARWDSGGSHLWGYWPPQGIDHITDIEALNVTDGAAWAVYWPTSPLLEARTSGQLRVWEQPVTSPRGLAVHDDRVLLLGGRRRGCARQDGLTTAHYCHMTDGEAVVVEEAALTMPNGDPVRSYARPVGRGRNLYLHGRSTKQWYVLGL
ncbi:hypothetical protein AB0D94_03280 [Streptomyces sp. NPDC048255]|uniref:hypothetical protein n=1 Tax=Streptomyces sp. NPDC048255 TaxID=3154713 RepID=UPI0033EAEBEF